MRKGARLATAFGEYRIVSKLGQGGAGQVYLAEDQDGRRVAVKVLSLREPISDKRKRFKNETRFCYATSHKNVLRILDFGATEDSLGNVPFYVMEHFPCSLRNVLEEGLAPSEVLPIFSEILDGVEAAHLKNVVHRDLKPENILIDRKGSRLVVADFGIAHFSEEELHTIVETDNRARLANFQYAAPEQRLRGQKVDLRADIYALGLILNEAFTGSIPLGTGYRVIASVATEYSFLDDIVEKMIRQNPEERYPSIGEVKTDISIKIKLSISRQKLSATSGDVVPGEEMDDPLVCEPIEIVDFDWNDNELTLVLSQPVNPLWVSALQHIGSHSSVPKAAPRDFRFSGNEARVRASEDRVQDIINFFKGYIPRATTIYERNRREMAQEEEQERIRVRRAAIEREEARARVLANTKL